MRSLSPALLAYLQGNSGIKVRQLLWISARNRITGDVESVGLWSGEDHQNFFIDGEERTYYGCGQFVSFGNLTLESTLNIRRFVAIMTPISHEIEQVFRGYDAKMAPAQTHLAFFSTETNNLIEPPTRIHKGWIDKMPISTPAVGGQGEARIDMVGNSRILTNRLALKRSNDTQRKRLANDSFFADVNATGQVQTPWGSKTVSTRGGTVRRISEKIKGG